MTAPLDAIAARVANPATDGRPSPRIVSLIASATEIVHALGAGQLQVGRSHECDWPASVLELPALTAARFKVDGSSLDIDQRVKSLVEGGLAVYEVFADRLKAVGPDVILTQDQCEVCAVSLADVERAVCTWTDRASRIVSLRPHTMADVYADIQRVADEIGWSSEGRNLVSDMQQRLSAIAQRVAGAAKPRLAFIEWIEPAMSGGHWMPELTEIAGGVSLFGETGANSPWIAWEDVAAADPDVILVAPCGYDLAVTTREMRALAGNAIWEGLRAVRDGQVFVADGNAYFNRPGPRLVESAEIMAEVLHPERCHFGHRDIAYRRLRAA
ncbi:MAG: cobalamin-binding protein [Hyphomicrobiaceae bacterium]